MSVSQLPLALRYSSDQRLETYLQAPSGLIAQLQAIVNERLRDWIYLAGVSGSGKTHLALALCAAAEQVGQSVAYLPLHVAAGHLRDALEALEGCVLVVLDGLEAIAGIHEDEIALFDFHNRARASGITLFYTARAMPDGLGLMLPDLRSRLAQCTRVALPMLDDVGRAAVLRERAQRRGLVLDEAAIEWLLSHEDRDLSRLLMVLDKLDRESLAAKRRVTMPFLREVIADGGGASALKG
ncbi:MAG TPA: DnaA regulatory inactivator Hda [Xylella sp.]